ncbi:MAG: hypothetical protein V4760_06735 [Bdellovibrionota bacterium]
MKFIFALTALVSFISIAATAAPAKVPNGLARLETQRLLFGNETTKTEISEIAGTQPSGSDCTIVLRKTRYGVYIAVSTLSGDDDVAVGLTNSYFTTQNLAWQNDAAAGVLKFTRLGVTNINERGEDYGNESAVVGYEKSGTVAKIKSVEVSIEPLDVDYDGPNGDPAYTSRGETHSMTCSAL